MTFASERATRTLDTLRTLAATIISDWALELESLPNEVKNILLGSSWSVKDMKTVIHVLSKNEGTRADGFEDVLLAHVCTVLIQKILDEYEITATHLSKSIDYFRTESQYPWWSTVSRMPTRVNAILRQSLNRTMSMQGLSFTGIIGLTNVPAMVVRANSDEVKSKKLQLKTVRNSMSVCIAQAVESWLLAISRINVKEQGYLQFRDQMISYSMQCTEIARATLEQSGHLDPTDILSNDATSTRGKIVQSVGILIDTFTTIREKLHTSLHQDLNRPNWILRNWLTYTIYFVAGTFGYTIIANRRRSIQDYICETHIFAQKVLKEYVFEPLTTIYKTIRFDTEKEILQLRARELAIDTQSLQRMMSEFSKMSVALPVLDSSESVSTGFVPETAAHYEHLLNSYENDVKTPIKSAMLGSMLQNVLIQIQKQKVDAGRMMAGMDNLLASNELNFQILTALPTLYVFFYWMSKIYSYFQRRRGVYDKQIRSHFHMQLRNIHKLMMKATRESNDEKQWAYKGRILTSLADLRQLAAKLSRDDSSMFVEDIRDLEKVPSGDQQVRNRVDIITRMYRSYPFLS